MKHIIFFTCIALEFTIIVMLIISHFSLQHRIWPPKNQKSWQQYLMLFLFNSTALLIILIGLLDWGSAGFPRWLRIAGFIAWVIGVLLAIWAIMKLGVKSTMGNLGELIKLGPYQYSRNPQYIGFMLSLFGWILITNSSSTFVVSLLACIPLWIVPFIEEPWMLNNYGESYIEYLHSVPRFLLRNKM